MQQDSRRFCKLIKRELNSGFGFVPFVGSGLSAASGIPTGQEILDYLSFCIDEAIRRGWNPRKDRWPDLTRSMNLDERTQWIKDAIDPVETPLISDSDVSSSSSAVRREAIGALSNWRTALHFLSRLDIQEDRPVLSAPDARVTDSFFISLTRDRWPNAAHVMLSHLATAMRIRTVLTTNFDTLIEEAFTQAQLPLVQFDVHIGMGLPDASPILAQRSIVKLHGGRYGLRADFSLDEMPSEKDMAAFMGYLSVRSDVDPEIKVAQNHLLVLGSSGDDKRSLRLIEYALKHDEELRLFWVCYDAETADRVLQYFGKNMPTSYRKRVYTIVQRETDLFLFEIFQRLTLSLPPAGGGYPAFWTVPPYPYSVKEPDRRKSFDDYKNSLTNTLQEMVADGNGGTLAVHGAGGASSVASAVFAESSRQSICIWLDLARFYGEDHLFAMMTSAIAQRLGIPLGMPITLNPQQDYLRRELEYYVRKARKPVVFFLNGRDGPDFLRSDDITATPPDDWESKSWYQDSEQLNAKRVAFWSFVEQLQMQNLVFVVLLRKTDSIPNSERFLVKQIPVLELSIDFETEQVVDSVMSWLSLPDERERQKQERFVYALSLFRYAIHPAALCSWALIKAPVQCRFDGKDNDSIRGKLGETWLKELIKRGAVRERPGGFVWMHQEVRISLQRKLSGSCESMKSECHEGIADWYAKLFRSSTDPRRV